MGAWFGAETSQPPTLVLVAARGIPSLIMCNVFVYCALWTIDFIKGCFFKGRKTSRRAGPASRTGLVSTTKVRFINLDMYLHISIDYFDQLGLLINVL